MRALEEARRAPRNCVGRDRAFTVDGHTGGGLFGRRTAEKIETQIVAHDAGEQFGLRPLAIRGAGRVEGRWLDRRPGGNPQRIYAGLLIEDLGDMPAFLQDRHAQMFVLDLRGAAAPVIEFRHLTPS